MYLPISVTPNTRITLGVNNRILIVDDSTETLPLYEEILKEQGYSVAVFEDGESAIKSLNKSNLPRLILLDVILKGKSVREFCDRFKEAFPNAETRIVAFSGLPEYSSIVTEIRPFVFDFFEKPSSIDLLLKKIASYMTG